MQEFQMLEIDLHLKIIDCILNQGDPAEDNDFFKFIKLNSEKFQSLHFYIRGCLIWLRQNNQIETDMSETRG